MKIAISCIILVCILTAACGCNDVGGSPETKGSSGEEVNNNLTGVNAQVEEVSVVVKSTEELKAAIKDSLALGADNEVYNRNRLRDIEYFYEPAVIFHGYKLLQIEVNEYYIFYYYMPESLMQAAEPLMFDYRIGIVFAVARPDDAFEDPLQPIIVQTGIRPNKDNVIFDEARNSLAWAVDQTRVYIQFPKSFTEYEEMLSFCKTVKVMIENQ